MAAAIIPRSSRSVARSGIAALVVSLAMAQPDTNVTRAAAWPASHMHTEVMYAPDIGGDVENKPVYYDFPNRRYRADLINLDGINFKNQSSYWLGTQLYIYTFDLGFCVHLDMGFGMMKPDWFQQGQLVGGIWRAHHSDQFDGFHYAVWTSVSAGDAGTFDYFSRNDTGAAFMMSAPSPEGLVINEYSSFTPTGFEGSSVFDLPAGITCINGTNAGAPLDTIAKFGRHIYGDVVMSAHLAGVRLV